MKQGFTLLLLSVCASVASAQGKFKPGYIRHANSDIDYGFVEQSRSSAALTLCRFKEQIEDTVEEYHADQLIGFGYEQPDERQYMSLPMDGRKVFMEVLIPNGKARLLKVNDRFFITVDNESVTELTNENVSETLAPLLGDCPGMTLPQKVKLSEFNLVRLFHDYNACSMNPVQFAAKLVDPKFRVAFGTGLELFSLTASADATGWLRISDFSNRTPVTLGFQVNRAISRKWELRTGFAYSPRTLRASSTEAPMCVWCEWGAISVSNDIRIAYNEFSIPLSIQFDIVKRQSGTVFVNAGAAYVINGNVTSNYASVSDYQGSGPSYNSQASQFVVAAPNSVRLNASVGYVLNVKGKKEMQFQMHWGYGTQSMTIKNPFIYGDVIYPDQKIAYHSNGLGLSVGIFIN